MLFLLMIPAALWLFSYNLLLSSKGQKGLDIFFKQFLLIATEVVAGLLLLDYFQVESARRICLLALAIHTLLLFGYAITSFLIQKSKAKNKQLA